MNVIFDKSNKTSVFTLVIISANYTYHRQSWFTADIGRANLVSNVTGSENKKKNCSEQLGTAKLTRYNQCE